MGSNQSSQESTATNKIKFKWIKKMINKGNTRWIKKPTEEKEKWCKLASDVDISEISVEHGKFLAAKRSKLLKQINLSISRRNGFNSIDKMDTICEEWYWGLNNSYDDTLQLHAMNCSICGEYISSCNKNFELDDRIRCKCEVRSLTNVSSLYEGFSEPRSGIENPRSFIDVTDRRSVKSTEDELSQENDKVFFDDFAEFSEYEYDEEEDNNNVIYRN
jgi:hypothetical protein